MISLFHVAVHGISFQGTKEKQEAKWRPKSACEACSTRPSEVAQPPILDVKIPSYSSTIARLYGAQLKVKTTQPEYPTNTTMNIIEKMTMWTDLNMQD